MTVCKNISLRYVHCIVSIIWNNPTSLHLYIHLAVSLQYSGYTIFFDNAQNFLYYIVLQFWLSTILIITSEWCHQKLTYETKLSTNSFCLPIRHQQIVQLFCNRGSLEGAIIVLKQYLGQKLTYYFYIWNCYKILHGQWFIQILLSFIYNMILYNIIPQIQIVQSGSLVCATWAWN
jgi:hypothetical protein